jgi:hypothetical protein
LSTGRPLRLARRLVAALALVWIAYVAAVNVLLNTPLGPMLVNRKPEKFTLHWQHGVSLWPGDIVLWNVTARGHVRRVEWHATSPRVHGRIGILSLAARTLDVPWVVADDVDASLTQAPDLPPPEHRDGGWTLRFGGIETPHLRRVRYGDTELTGDGTARFSFTKVLRGGPMEIAPSRFALRDVTIRHGKRQWLTGATLEVDLAIARHRREEATGWHKLALTDLRVVAHGRTPGLKLVMDSTRQLHGAIDDATHGTLALDLRFAHGELERGGKLDLAIPLAADGAGQTSQATATLAAHVGERIDLSLQLPPPPGSEGGIDAQVHVATRRLPLDGAWHELVEHVGGHVGVRWRFESLAWLGPLLTRVHWLTLDGAGEIQADVKLENGAIAPGTTLKIPDVALDAVVQGHRIGGRARADGRIAAGPDGALAPRLDIAVDEFRITSDDDPKAVFGLGRNLNLALSSSGRLAQFRDKLTAQLKFGDARIPDIGVYNAYLPQHAVKLLRGSGTLGGDLALDAEGRIARGSIGVGARGAQLRFGDIELQGDVDLGGKLAGADLVGRRFDFGGTTLKLRNVSITDSERANAQNWWADFTVGRGHLEWHRPFNLDATANAQLANVSVLLALFSRHRDYPGWVLRLVDAGTTQLAARVDVKPGTLVFDDVVARNRRFELKARLRHADKSVTGDLYLEWGKLGLGVALANGKRDFKLIGAEKWYDAQPSLLAK